MKRGIPIAGVVIALVPCGALSQSQPVAQPAGQAAPLLSPGQLTEARLAKPIQFEVENQRLEDVVNAAIGVIGVEAEIFWNSDGSAGLDRDATITLKSAGGSGLDVIERVLALAAIEGNDAATWQLTDAGTLQIGPRSRLNTYKRTEVYPVRDLLQARFDFTEAPEVDLDAAMQAGNGGGTTTIFRDRGGDSAMTPETTFKERADELIDLIESSVETEQWVANGGDGASLRLFQDVLVVTAPEYIHRQIEAARR